MNYAAIKNCDTANGIGVRISLFVSGCRHHCKNCFNAEAWDFNYGKPFTDKELELILSYMNHDYIKGISILGGEPLEPENQETVYRVLSKVHETYPNKDVWLYTGFTFEQLVHEKMPKEPYLRNILELVDTLVDGKFVEELKNLGLAFRGSSNQRILDCKKLIKEVK